MKTTRRRSRYRRTRGTRSRRTLHGTYNFATQSVQEPGAVPFAYAGFVTYDGKGHVSEMYTISFNGVVSRAVTETGTYSVNPDCTSSEVDSGPGSIGTQHYDEFLKPDGSEFMYIQTDPGAVSAGELIRTVKGAGAN